MLKDIPPQKQYNILVIGEECIDLYRYGQCKRISPEAPVPIFLEEKTERRPGMAANVSKNIETLGHKTVLISNEEQIIKERIVDRQFHQQLLRVDRHDHCEPLTILFLKESLNSLEIEFDATIISDYDKGFLSHQVISEMMPLLPKPVFIDSKKRDLSSFEECIIKINEFEYENANKFPDKYELIITCGKFGAKYKDEMFAVEKIEIKDICGAGDSFLSALAIRYLDSSNFSDAIHFANAAASVSVTVPGVYSPTMEEVTNEICY